MALSRRRSACDERAEVWGEGREEEVKVQIHSALPCTLVEPSAGRERRLSEVAERRLARVRESEKRIAEQGKQE